jgi:hypothetical protein
MARIACASALDPVGLEVCRCSGRTTAAIAVVWKRLSQERGPHIVLDRRRTVYAERGVEGGPFDDVVPSAGERREDRGRS